MSEHYQVKDLISRLDERAQFREIQKMRDKERNERNETIKASDQFIQNYWCEDDKIEYGAYSVKVIESDWTNSSQKISYFASKCPKCKRTLKRLITDKWRDSYYKLSFKVKRDRIDNYRDLLQPHQSGFNMLYNKPI
jgi:hypothetical protein